MHDLALGCVFRGIDRFACPDATNSGKLLSTLVGVACPVTIAGLCVEAKCDQLKQDDFDLRVKNAGCYENVAVESAEFRELRRGSELAVARDARN
jgi:hypothetical protein